MRWFRFAVLILVATILQTGAMGVLSVTSAQIRPDLLLILLVFFALRGHPADTVGASFLIGFAADLISPVPGLMGPRIISFGLFGTLASSFRGILSTRRLAAQGIMIFLVGVLTAGLSHVLSLLRTDAVSASLAAELLWQPLYSALLGPFLSLPVGWWMAMNKRERYYGVRRALSR
jgi:rod shape-determining protein MreD